MFVRSLSEELGFALSSRQAAVCSNIHAAERGYLRDTPTELFTITLLGGAEKIFKKGDSDLVAPLRIDRSGEWGRVVTSGWGSFTAGKLLEASLSFAFAMGQVPGIPAHTGLAVGRV
jgi:hypothetical protein